MNNLSPPWQRQFLIFKRQYLQLQGHLRFPDPECLRSDGFQDLIYKEMFSDENLIYQPPQRYQFRVLKELLRRIESSITDWDEEGISDDLTSKLSKLLSTPVPSEAVSAHQKSYVTYTLSSLPNSPSSPTITLLESHTLLSASGTTGFRTWEASLHLSSYLCSPACQPYIKNKTIMELGAGTGFLSILCAAHLHAADVIATDGFGAILSDIQTNLYLNHLDSSPHICTRELKWGHALVGTEHESFLEGRNVDLVLGADLTYDCETFSALVGTFADIVELFPQVKILIAAIIRNAETWEQFGTVCAAAGFLVRLVEFKMIRSEDQEGPFHRDDMEIQIYWIVPLKKSRTRYEKIDTLHEVING